MSAIVTYYVHPEDVMCSGGFRYAALLAENCQEKATHVMNRFDITIANFGISPQMIAWGNGGAEAHVHSPAISFDLRQSNVSADEEGLEVTLSRAAHALSNPSMAPWNGNRRTFSARFQFPGFAGNYEFVVPPGSGANRVGAPRLQLA